MAVVKSHTLLGFKTNTLMKACCGSGNGPFNFNMHNECGEERVTTCSHRASRSHLVCFLTTTIQEADLLQVATVIGLEEEVEVTDDIGIADTILASSTEIKQNPWIRSIAKLHQVPAFVVKVTLMPATYIFVLGQSHDLLDCCESIDLHFYLFCWGKKPFSLSIYIVLLFDLILVVK